MRLRATTWSLLLPTLLLVGLASAAPRSKNLLELNEENWRNVLKGEWMVEFFAPWCPACKDLQKSWNSFADWSRDLNINVAEVDVTTNPGLSGRFLVTALPTIYHVRDGVFRLYTGPRDKSDFISYIEDKRWTMSDPIPNYKHPDSAQMGVVAVFFRLSMSVRDFHGHLVENVGIPPWASYAGFAAVTLGLGCILGFIIVCIIDYVFPTSAYIKRVAAAEEKKAHKKEQKQKGKGGNQPQQNNHSAANANHKKDGERSGNTSQEESADETGNQKEHSFPHNKKEGDASKKTDTKKNK